MAILLSKKVTALRPQTNSTHSDSWNGISLCYMTVDWHEDMSNRKFDFGPKPLQRCRCQDGVGEAAATHLGKKTLGGDSRGVERTGGQEI
jgi:hypothetical protein